VEYIAISLAVKVRLWNLSDSNFSPVWKSVLKIIKSNEKKFRSGVFTISEQ